MTTTNFPILTVDFINNNIGKEITWFAYGYSGNLPYKGVCILKGLQQEGDRIKPVVEHIKGDELDFGWVEDGVITYSDSGRPVSVGNPFDLYEVEREGMYYGIAVPSGTDPKEFASKIFSGDIKLSLTV